VLALRLELLGQAEPNAPAGAFPDSQQMREVVAAWAAVPGVDLPAPSTGLNAVTSPKSDPSSMFVRVRTASKLSRRLLSKELLKSFHSSASASPSRHLFELLRCVCTPERLFSEWARRQARSLTNDSPTDSLEKLAQRGTSILSALRRTDVELCASFFCPALESQRSSTAEQTSTFAGVNTRVSADSLPGCLRLLHGRAFVQAASSYIAKVLNEQTSGGPPADDGSLAWAQLVYQAPVLRKLGAVAAVAGTVAKLNRGARATLLDYGLPASASEPVAPCAAVFGPSMPALVELVQLPLLPRFYHPSDPLTGRRCGHWILRAGDCTRQDQV
jgi:hypothetical protein